MIEVTVAHQSLVVGEDLLHFKLGLAGSIDHCGRQCANTVQTVVLKTAAQIRSLTTTMTYCGSERKVLIELF